jgi:hypothetical protein
MVALSAVISSGVMFLRTAGTVVRNAEYTGDAAAILEPPLRKRGPLFFRQLIFFNQYVYIHEKIRAGELVDRLDTQMI